MQRDYDGVNYVNESKDLTMTFYNLDQAAIRTYVFVDSGGIIKIPIRLLNYNYSYFLLIILWR